MGRLPTNDELKRWNPNRPDGLDPISPEDLVSEKAVLQSILVLPSGLKDLQRCGLLPRHFFDDANRAIYSTFTALDREGIPIDIVTVQGRMRTTQHNGQTVYDFVGGMGYLAHLANSAGTGALAVYYAEQMIEQSRRRKLVYLADEIIKHVNENQKAEDIEGMVDSFAESAKETQNKGKGARFMSEIFQTVGDLRAYIIEGVLRIGETMNIVAPTKRGKSWLVIALVLCIVTGRRWLGKFPCVKGKALVIDNELHQETGKHRVPKVADAMGIAAEEYQDMLAVEYVRGKGMDIITLGDYLQQYEPGDFSVIVLDAGYRFLPEGWEENSNPHMTRFYNLLDSYADRLQCSFVVITHSSKGDQSGKSVTDVGSGAGSQSRATDTHAIMRQHEDPAAVVFDLAVRSSPPLDAPIVLRFDWPVWFVDHDLDPAALHRPGKRGKKVETPEPEWTAERFAKEFGTPQPKLMLALVEAGCGAGLSDRKATSLVKRAAASGKLFKWPTGDKREFAYATVAPPAPVSTPARPSKVKAKKPPKSKRKKAS